MELHNERFSKINNKSIYLFQNLQSYIRNFIIYIGFLFVLIQCGAKDFIEPDNPVLPTNKQFSFFSPDSRGKIEIILADLSTKYPFYPSGECIYYKMYYDSHTLVEWSPLGLEYENHNFFSNLSIVGKKDSSGVENYILAHGKKSEIKQPFNEYVLQLKNKTGKLIEFAFRLQNDGAAFQYRIPMQESIPATGKITKEYSGFRFPNKTIGWMQEYQEASKVSPAYEYYYTPIIAGESDSGKASIRSIFQPLVNFTGLVIFGSDGWAYPALFKTPTGEFVILTESGLTSQYAGTHLKVDSKYKIYRVEYPAEKEGQGVGESIPLSHLPFRSTWKVFGFGNLKTITESTIVTDLAEPLHPYFNGKIPDWIFSGKSTWDWWSYLSTGDLERQKKYVDSASEFGWEYVLVDANWNLWNQGNPEAQIKELVAYSIEKNVSVILWYNSGGSTNTVTEEPRDRMHEKETRRKEFARLKEWGIRGVKIDFWQSDKQSAISTYLDVLRDAAEFGINVNFHGCTMPRGWERQYPNLMTMEAVKGAEWYRFPVFRGPSAADNVYYAFTRNVVGPMDYTPIVFMEAYKQQKIGFAHSLALSVIFESGIQHFADNADDPNSGYKKIFSDYPFVKEFLRKVPSSWDDTIFLEGNPDSHIVYMRRKAKNFYIAGIQSQKEPRVINIELGFLPEGDYMASTITEKTSGDNLEITSAIFKQGDTIKIELGRNGGFVTELSLMEKEK